MFEHFWFFVLFSARLVCLSPLILISAHIVQCIVTTVVDIGGQLCLVVVDRAC